MVGFFYLLWKGTSDEEEFEDLALEIYKFCTLIIYRDGIKFGNNESESVEALKALDSLAHGILAQFYL